MFFMYLAIFKNTELFIEYMEDMLAFSITHLSSHLNITVPNS